MHTPSIPRRRRRLIAVLATAAALLGAIGVATPTSAAVPTGAVLTSTKVGFVRGESASFTVTVAKAASKPKATGNVTVSIDGAPVGTKPLVSAKAIIATTLTSIGSHTVTAAYAGDANYPAGPTNSIIITVGQGMTNTTIKNRANPVTAGTTAAISSLTKRVGPAAGGTLASSVTYTADGPGGAHITATVEAGVTGSSQWRPKLANGNWNITAAYNGNLDFEPSISTSTVVQVGPTAGLDSDGDRLPDSAETNTGVYVSPTNTGTDPNNADTDGDAIKDGDEVLGTLAGLNLPKLGFSALHRDLAAEFDWYDDTAECGPHSHRPAADSIAEIAAAYAAAPLTNPDGTTGINFIADYGQGGVFTGGNFVPGPADGVIAADGVPGNSLAGEYNTVKSANFASKRNGYFHYVLSAHTNEGSTGSGGGELIGDDILSVDACYFTDHHDIANLVFHEMGHNLGLHHGGDEDQNFKPNYNSVMNYGITGVDTDCDGVGDNVLGYSSGTNIDLDENALIEANGVCGPGHPIDWNKNGIIDPDPIALDLNPGEGLGLTVLHDYNDWANITFAGLSDPD